RQVDRRPPRRAGARGRPRRAGPRPGRHHRHPARVPRGVGELRARAVMRRYGTEAAVAPAAGAAARLHVILPGDVADPGLPSGGNVYDLRVCDGLGELGWRVDRTAVPGDWPLPGPAAADDLGRALAALPDGAPVLI